MMMMRQTWLMTVVMLLLAFLTHLQWCHCCLEEERIGLLDIKSWIAPKDLALSDWVDNIDGSDCCKWSDVECDNTTNRVTKIDLGFIRDLGKWGDLYLNASLFLSFQDLKVLNLGDNYLVCSSENQGFEVLSSKLKKLEELYLNDNKFDDNILSSLSGFTSIKILDLSRNMLTGWTSIYGLKMLEKLFLYGLNINGRSILLESLGTLPFLKTLGLGDSNLNGTRIGPGLEMLEELHLINVSNISGSGQVESLGAFPSLKSLYLTENNWKGTLIGSGLYNLTKLENLYLSFSSELPTNFLQKIGSLSALKVLSLLGCDLNGTLPNQGWCELKKLEELVLSQNKLEGLLPTCLENMTSLRSLNAAYNQFVGNIASSPLSSLTSLEYLIIDSNHFEIPSSFMSFMNLSNLKTLSCGDNNIITEPTVPRNLIPKFQLRSFRFTDTTHAEIPHFVYTQHELRFVDLSRNNISRVSPIWMVENNTKLEILYLSDNSFIWSLRLPNHSSHNLKIIDISNNKIHGPIFKDICFLFPTLKFLLMAENELSGGVPSCVGNMSSLSYLDLSNNFLRSLEQFTSIRLSFLKLSNNKLEGEIPLSIFNSSSIEYLYLDGNNFRGKIWDFPFKMSPLFVLAISNNHISGKLPHWISNMSNLEAIDLSNNQFQGHIPSEFCKLHFLKFLDLSENDLSGPIPSCFNLPYITHVHLQKNQLSGQLTNSFANSSSLVTLDLKENNLNGPIPNWIGNLSAMEVLLVGANLFYGEFSVGLCKLENLNILDISQNKLTGALPSCLGNLSFNTTHSEKIFLGRGVGLNEENMFPAVYVDEVIEFTTKRNSYNYSGNILDFMSGMDLSCNNFTGEIPEEMGYLIGIYAINLSHNNLHGTIPATLSNLQYIESLDLSYNNLIGRIPSQLTQLTNLEVFNMSYNNLSGEIPEMKNQFGTFDEYSYQGNPFLCGPLLQNKCNGKESPSPLKLDHSNTEQEGDGFIDMEVFYVSFGICYITMVLTIIAILCINPYWRRMWFYFIEVCIDTCHYFMMDCYYFVEDNFCRWTNFRRW